MHRGEENGVEQTSLKIGSQGGPRHMEAPQVDVVGMFSASKWQRKENEHCLFDGVGVAAGLQRWGAQQ